jgi:hypothetical protein
MSHLKMITRKQICLSLLTLFAVTTSPGVAHAQDPQDLASQEPTVPKAAGRSLPDLDNGTDDQSNERWQPDNTPVTGLEAPSLGTQQLEHSYWVPGVQYASTIQSLPPGQSGPSSWYADHYLAANLSLFQDWSRNQLAMNYSGGAFLTGSGQQNNGTFQVLSIADSINWQRLQIQLFENFSYLPESAFGFMGGSGVSIPGVGGSLGGGTPGLGSSVTPNQSIYSANGPRESDTSGTQLTYQFSPRGSVTVAGSYNLLHFTEAENVDSDMVVASIGYNYQLTRTDSFGVFYRFSGFHYSGDPQAFGANSINAAYNKKLTQRVALGLFGGPQITNYRQPIGTQSRLVNASAGASLAYQWGRNSISLTYFYGLTNGGGVLVGTLTNEVTLGYSRQLTREWAGNFSFGYAHNNALGSGSLLTLPAYDDWFVAGGASRPFGRNVNFSLNYMTQVQGSNLGACTGLACSSYTENTIAVSLQWHARPMVL